ncbi:MAG: DUF2797 domain-containing protein [Gammaproteobacteria bacterium]
MPLGHLHKMRVAPGEPVRYSLRLDDEEFPLDDRLGEPLSIEASGRIHCTSCGRQTPRSYGQGHCYVCLTTLAQCDNCIVKPELCHFHAGTCREPEWGLAHCMQPHVVYVANSSGVKVGITRETQLSTRWIDQGAVQAMPVCQVSSRLDSGLWEVALKTLLNDRTDWRRMLSGVPESVDLAAERTRVLEELSVDPITLETVGTLPDAVPYPGDNSVREFNYPVIEYPAKVKSLTLDKTPEVSGELLGIKGQYLILDTGVFNVRRHTGYEVRVRMRGG